MRIAVGDVKGGVTILKHTSCTSLRVEKRITIPHSDRIVNIAAHRNIFVTSSADQTVIVWNTNSFQPLTSLKHSHYVFSASISDQFIITTTLDGLFYIFENDSNFSLRNDLRIPESAHMMFKFSTITLLLSLVAMVYLVSFPCRKIPVRVAKYPTKG